MKIPHDPVALEQHFKDDDKGPLSNQGYMPYLNRFILDKVWTKMHQLWIGQILMFKQNNLAARKNKSCQLCFLSAFHYTVVEQAKIRVCYIKNKVIYAPAISCGLKPYVSIAFLLI